MDIPQIQLVKVEKLCSQSHKQLSFPHIHTKIVMKMLSLIFRALLITLGVSGWSFSTEMMLLSHLASTKRSLSVNISCLSLLQITMEITWLSSLLHGSLRVCLFPLPVPVPVSYLTICNA